MPKAESNSKFPVKTLMLKRKTDIESKLNATLGIYAPTLSRLKPLGSGVLLKDIWCVVHHRKKQNATLFVTNSLCRRPSISIFCKGVPSALKKLRLFVAKTPS